MVPNTAMIGILEVNDRGSWGTSQPFPLLTQVVVVFNPDTLRLIMSRFIQNGNPGQDFHLFRYTFI